ncbi:MAG: hypothetical protein GF417_01915, partial [Candidatus Latescibacteria bacterium]|nr:hypothetical protein [bacterium]MBD3423184.1 hypothetical protein [Candidatus Latescibacterota bacterium]
MLRRVKYTAAAAVLVLVQAAGIFSSAAGSDNLTAPSALEMSQSDKVRSRKMVSVFNQDDDFLISEKRGAGRVLRLSGERILSPSIMQADRGYGSPRISGNRKKNMAVSIIASAVLPGLGEMYMYSQSGDLSILARAIGLMAVEGYL